MFLGWCLALLVVWAPASEASAHQCHQATKARTGLDGNKYENSVYKSYYKYIDLTLLTISNNSYVYTNR